MPGRVASAAYVLVVINMVVMTTQFCDDFVQIEPGTVQFSLSKADRHLSVSVNSFILAGKQVI